MCNKIILEKRVIKYITSRHLKHQNQLKTKILFLQSIPRPTDYKQLKGFEPYLRVDQGEYRIIYRIQKNTIFVVLVGKRNDDEVYRIFKKLL